MLSPFLVCPLKTPLSITPPTAHQPTNFCFPVLAFPYTEAWNLLRTKGLSSLWYPSRPSFASYETGTMGSSMCTLCLVVYSLGAREVLGSYCSSNGATSSFSSLGPFSSSSVGDLLNSSMVVWDHRPLHWSGTGRASQETAISGYCQQVLVGIHNSVWVIISAYL